jgi:opacity protein-like surface antigen
MICFLIKNDAMKKYGWLMGISFCFVQLSGAQSNTYEYGLHGGININSAFGSSINAAYKGTLPGLSLGAHVKINTSTHFGIKASIDYDQQGWAYRSLAFEDMTGTTFAKGDVLRKLNYLNVPIVAEYTVGKKVKFKANAGAFFGLLLSNQIVTQITDPFPPNTESTTRSKSQQNIQATNFGLSAGAGLQIPISKKMKLDIDLRNHYGLSNIYKKENALRLNTFSILLGLTFPM